MPISSEVQKAERSELFSASSDKKANREVVLAENVAKISPAEFHLFINFARGLSRSTLDIYFKSSLESKSGSRVCKRKRTSSALLGFSLHYI